MRVVGIEEIRRAVSPSAAIAAMRDAVIAYSRGECATPMPMICTSPGTTAARCT